MGLLNETGRGNITYVQTFGTKFEIRVGENDPEATTRMNKSDKLIHVKHYPGLSGKIYDLQVKDTEYQGKKFRTLEIYLQDGIDKYLLQLPYNSSHVRSFYMMLLNADLDLPITFSIGKKKDKDATVLYMSQQGVNIKWRYNKEYQYGLNEPRLPEWEQVTVKGEQIWDNTKEMAFLANLIKPIAEKLRAEHQSARTEAAPVAQPFDDGDFPTMEPEGHGVGQPPTDALPF